MDQLRVRAYLDVLLGQDSSPVLADGVLLIAKRARVPITRR